MASALTNKNQHFTLQKVIFSENVAISQPTLYYRARGQHQVDDASASIYFEKNTIISFNTYFNSLSYFKWNKYTKVENVFLELKLQGIFKVILKSVSWGGDEVQSKVFYFDSSQPSLNNTAFVDFDDNRSSCSDFPVQSYTCSFEGLESFPHFYFEAISLAKSSILHGAEYFTVLEKERASSKTHSLELYLHLRE